MRRFKRLRGVHGLDALLRRTFDAAFNHIFPARRGVILPLQQQNAIFDKRRLKQAFRVENVRNGRRFEDARAQRLEIHLRQEGVRHEHA